LSTDSKSAPGSLPRLVVSSGEPAGIGPDLCLWLGTQSFAAQITVLADLETLRARAAASPLFKQHHINFTEGPATEAQQPGQLAVIAHPSKAKVDAGVLNPANAEHVLAMLDTAMQGCETGSFDAMVTAPLQKSTINDAGIAFTGHTEYLADYFACENVMLLASGDLRVALATTHLPLREVADAINSEGLERSLRILHNDLITKFGLPQPKILVCGLNPHAGEGGHMGREEIDIIEPLLQKLRAEGMDLIGPLPADTLFIPKHLDQADAVLAMYHDQGLPVLKHAGFGGAVNITLGLPIIRTSVDHGTALDLAGSDKIDTGSMRAAILSAIEQCQAKSR
jgi:4-hydroxythreonine-4-phosphate dehydrogenase